ncbi:MAG: transposase [Burkholderiaceae bacterium]
MLDVDAIVDANLQRLSPEAITALAQRMLGHIREQQQHLRQRDEHRATGRRDCAASPTRPSARTPSCSSRPSSSRKVNFELARLKGWKFGAKTEAMSAEQRRLFDETMAEDEASLQALLEQLQGKAAQGQSVQRPAARAHERQALPRTCVASKPPRARRHHVPDAGLRDGRWCAWARTWAEARHRAGGTADAGMCGKWACSAARCWCKSRCRRRSSTAACPPAEADGAR